jgi:hypothetical protein
MEFRAQAPVPIRWRWLDWPANARWAVAASYLALLTWALLAPASTFDAIDEAFPYQDKVAHGAIFLALALLVRWALPAGWGSGRRRVAALAALVCYAASMEALQALIVTSQRTFEWQDMAFNQAGLCAGWVLFARALAGAGAAPPRREAGMAGDGAITRRRAVR